MQAIDPFGYSHICDHAASYHPRRKSRPDPMDHQWATVTDMTGRGYKQGRPISSSSRQNVITSLDSGNRFFDDNMRIYKTYGTPSKVAAPKTIVVSPPVIQQ